MRGRGRGTGRTLATVFFTDMVGSTDLAARLGDQRWRRLLSAYHGIVGRAIRRAGGREVDSAGDGLFAVFGSPASAIDCAARLTDELHRNGLEVRTGLHMGEVELMGGKVGGIAVHLGARVAALAAPGEILVTSTVRDLVAGSEVRCVDRGVRELKGIPGEWRIFAVDRPGAPALDASALDGLTGDRAAAWWRRRTVMAGVGAALLLAFGTAGTLVAIHHAGSSGVGLVVPESNSVARLSAAAGGFTTTLRTGGSQPADVVVGGGGVWLVTYLSKTLVHVDSATGVIVETSSVEGTPTGLAFGRNALWITAQFGLSGGTGGSVLRFNTVSNVIDSVITVGDGVQAIAVSTTPDAVWATNALENTLIRIDPATNGVAATIPLGHPPTSVAAGSGAIWVGCADMTLLRIDPTRNTVTSTISLRLHSAVNAVSVGAGAVWVASSLDNTIIRVDPANGSVVTSIGVDSGPAAVAAGDAAVWVAASRSGMVDRIDPATNTVVGRYPVHGSPHGVAADGQDAWVTVAAQ